MADTRTHADAYEAGLLALLDIELPPERAALVRRLVSGLLETYRKYGVLPDSTPGIREERDRR